MRAVLKGIGILFGLLIGIGYMAGGGLAGLASSNMQGIENQVAIDSVKQYELVARNGNAIDTCVHAGLVAAAFVQAKDEGNYRIWRARQTEDCTKAGMPF